LQDLGGVDNPGVNKAQARAGVKGIKGDVAENVDYIIGNLAPGGPVAVGLTPNDCGRYSWAAAIVVPPTVAASMMLRIAIPGFHLFMIELPIYFAAIRPPVNQVIRLGVCSRPQLSSPGG
jgi:hypothetical protein